MSIVYDGVNGDGQGNLFEGLKLWIAHRVPQRDRWVNLVEDNGGTVVRLEKQADMLIADNLKKGGIGPPPESYSWKWIDFSVRNGRLEDKNDYLVGRPDGFSREAGSSERAKATRTPFSRQDDLILTKWVMQCEAEGSSVSGGDIYKKLEKKHPQHTWQSWRDRWLKKLSSIPRSKVNNEVVEPATAKNGHAAVDASAAAPLRQEPPRIQIQPSRARVFFTQEEDRLLLEYVRKSRKEFKSLSGNKIYQEFALTHPRHTWNSWRDRWVRHLSLEEPLSENEAHDVLMTESEGDAQLQPKRQKTVANSDKPVAVRRSTPGPSSAVQKPNPKSDDERLKRNEEKKKRNRAARLIQRVWRSHAVRQQSQMEAAVIPLQAMIRGYLYRKREAQRLVEALEAGQTTLKAVTSHLVPRPESQPEAHDSENETDLERAEDVAREEFYSDLHDYCQVIGVEPQTQARINGYMLDVWQVFRAATNQASNVQERNWLQVADNLGLVASDFPGFAEELRDWYMENLAGFEESIREYDNDDGDDVPTSDAVTAPKQPASDSSSSALRSSPPVAAGSKRTRQQSTMLPSDLSYPSDGSRKRRRLNKDLVIPATPEDKLETGRNVARSEEGRTSPLQRRSRDKSVVIEISSGEEIDSGPEDLEEDELPEQTGPPLRKVVEPETQDWHIASNHDDDGDDDDETRPSQQLRLESEAHMVHEQKKPEHYSGAASQRNGSMTRVLRSSPRRAAPVATAGAVSAGTHTKSKAVKRTLPPQYRRESALTTSAPAPVPVKLPASSHVPVSASRQRQQFQSSLPSNSTRPAARSSDVRAHSAQNIQSSIANNALQGSKPDKSASQQDANFIWDSAAVDAQINHFEALGYKQEHIIEAIEASTFQRGPMVIALESLSKRRGIPSNTSGVWTKEDDADLDLIWRMEKGKDVNHKNHEAISKMKVEAWKAKDRLHTKHGKEGVARRLEYKREAAK